MFLLYPVVIGLILGVIAGGRAGGLARLEFRWAPAIVAGLLTQVVLFTDTVAEQVGDLGPGIYVASTLLVVAAVLRNVRIRGMPFVALGAACNVAAILANGGFMPASQDALASLGVSAPSIYSNSSAVPDPALWPLTDIFALPSWLPMANVFSVGDVFIGVGVALVIVIHMRRQVPMGGSVAQAA